MSGSPAWTHFQTVLAPWKLWKATLPMEHPLIRLNVDLGSGALAGVNTTVAISPDGTRIVFPARAADGKQPLATRLLSQAAALFCLELRIAAMPSSLPMDSGWDFRGQSVKEDLGSGWRTGNALTSCACQGVSWGVPPRLAEL
jgi:hypothetical protein